MKKLFWLLFVCISFPAWGGSDIPNSSVNFVYQLDTSETEFEFSATKQNGCGSKLYRVKSPNAAVANRKFSLVLTAFTTGSNLAFHDKEICEGIRSIVSWVRLTK